MAERRMFSKRIAESARFLMMPPSTQALYFHLGLNADDDGVVEAFPILRMLQCSEDDLRILSAKNFVQVLNDDLVTYISDWNTNNKLRADRKIDSLYKDLLLQINPDVKLLEPRERADRKHGTSQGQPKDGVVEYSRVEYSVVEDRLEKDSVVEVSKENAKKAILDLFQDLFINTFNQKPKFDGAEIRHIYSKISQYDLSDLEYVILESFSKEFYQNIDTCTPSKMLSKKNIESCLSRKQQDEEIKALYPPEQIICQECGNNVGEDKICHTCKIKVSAYGLFMGYLDE